MEQVKKTAQETWEKVNEFYKKITPKGGIDHSSIVITRLGEKGGRNCETSRPLFVNGPYCCFGTHCYCFYS